MVLISFNRTLQTQNRLTINIIHTIWRCASVCNLIHHWMFYALCHAIHVQRYSFTSTSMPHWSKQGLSNPLLVFCKPQSALWKIGKSYQFDEHQAHSPGRGDIDVREIRVIFAKDSYLSVGSRLLPTEIPFVFFRLDFVLFSSLFIILWSVIYFPESHCLAPMYWQRKI